MGNIGTRQSSRNTPHGCTFVPADLIIIVAVAVAVTVGCGIPTLVVTPGLDIGVMPVADPPMVSGVDKVVPRIVGPEVVDASNVIVLVYV
jgi:hypothetical protein